MEYHIEVRIYKLGEEEMVECGVSETVTITEPVEAAGNAQKEVEYVAAKLAAKAYRTLNDKPE